MTNLHSESLTHDIVILGAGITGLAIARSLLSSHPARRITIIEKETGVAQHASGRNSGVLHAGFYYTASSLKAKFCREGNAAWKKFCAEKNLPINPSGKLVLAKDASQVEQLKELERRGIANGVQVSLISKAEAQKLEPAAETHEIALYSPSTATISPTQCSAALFDELKSRGVEFVFGSEYRALEEGVLLIESKEGDSVQRTKIKASLVINCAGLYADKIARDFGFSKNYTVLPFKGLYLPYKKNKSDLKMSLYPVPDLGMPFLGVHFTVTVDGTIKVGPTATPAFWRENYKGLENFSLNEMRAVLFEEAKLFITNKANFRTLAFEEIRKYNKSYLISEARKLAPSIDPDGFGQFTKPGIRAQLLDQTSGTLVQDFIIEGDKKSVHVLNAVSPAFTCAFPFAEHVIRQFVG